MSNDPPASTSHAAQSPAPASKSQTGPTIGPSAAALRRIALIFTAWILAWWALVGVFLAGVIPGGWFTMAGVALASVAPVPVLMRGFRDDAYPSAWTRLFVLRPFWYVLLLVPLIALTAATAALLGWAFVDPLTAGRMGVFAAASLVISAAVIGYWGSRRLVVHHIDAAHPTLPAAFDGFRIAQLSDLHIGPHSRRGHITRVVRAVEEAAPDLIVHTGDQVDDFDADIHHFVKHFGRLAAPAGVFAVAGNHDIYAGWPGIRDGLVKAGIRVLVNQAEPIARGDDALWIAGIGDPAATQWGGDPRAPAPDPDATMRDVPDGAFSLVLAHNPALWPHLRARGASLTLSGHTHHGQISIPALGWCLASPFLEYSMGRYEHGGNTLYINPGTNYWGLPLRLGAWPEVTIVTLRRAAPQS